MHARTSVALTSPDATRRSLSIGISIPARQQQHVGLRLPRSVFGGILLFQVGCRACLKEVRYILRSVDACRSMNAASCGALLWFSCYTATTTHRASATSKQQCCWLSMSIGSSGGTAVKSAALMAAPLWFGGASLLRPPFVASAACCVASPYGTRYYTILCPGIHKYVELSNSSYLSALNSYPQTGLYR